MFRRLAALFQRYAAAHRARLCGVAIGPPGRRRGNVERVEARDGALLVSGWAEAEEVRLSWAGGTRRVTDFAPRADVAARRRDGRATGFEIRLPGDARDLVLEARHPDGRATRVTLPHPSDAAGPRARARLRGAFAVDMLRAVPLFCRHALRPATRDRTRAAIKRALGLEAVARAAGLDAAWLGPARARTRPATPVTIVLPVYNAFDLLRACLARVEAHTDLPWHLIVVEDASSDTGLRPWLAEWAAARADRVTLILHAANAGFVLSVNDALAVARGRPDGVPVILLNSDAMVPPGWAGRLIAPLADASVASVTPMSNAAEILSVPAIGPGVALAPGQGDALDRVAASFAPLPAPELPTGVGFCMALSQRWLARVPGFDPAFGRGYGEEVDWCRRTRALGARHVAAANLFVEHVGGQSFGAPEKVARLRRSAAILARRYPGFEAEVHGFIAADPLATPRLALAVALAALRGERLPVLLAHSLGGGAETALLAEVAEHPAAVVLRVGGALRWQVEVHQDGAVQSGQTDDLDLVERLLAPATRREVIYSCGVGDPDPASLPAVLLRLARAGPEGGAARITVRMHDYFPLSPSYCLLDSGGRYAGLPAPDDRDPAHAATAACGRTVTLAEWRGTWGRLIDAAAEVTVFSRASADLVRAAYPGAVLRLRPHRLAVRPRPVRLAPGRAGAVGVLGNLNLQKGAQVLARIAATHPERRFVVIGLVDCRIAMPRNVAVHGAYLPGEISDLAEAQGIAGWLMPAIWPETFSFATHEALATGLPVAGFALGGQGEALMAAANGIAVAPDPQQTAPDRLFAALAQRLAEGGAGQGMRAAG